MTNEHIGNAAAQMMTDEHLATVTGGMSCDTAQVIAKSYQVEGDVYVEASAASARMACHT